MVLLSPVESFVHWSPVKDIQHFAGWFKMICRSPSFLVLLYWKPRESPSGESKKRLLVEGKHQSCMGDCLQELWNQAIILASHPSLWNRPPQMPLLMEEIGGGKLPSWGLGRFFLMIYKGLGYIPGGCLGFLPSTVSHSALHLQLIGLNQKEGNRLLSTLLPWHLQLQ